MRRALAWIGSLVLGLAIAGAGGLVLSLSWDASSLEHVLEEQGVYGTAFIDAKETRAVKGGVKTGQPMFRPDYFVSYSFEAKDGAKYTGEARVSQSFFSAIDVGGATPVRYVADDPRRNEVEFGHMAAKNYVGLSGGAFFLLAGLSLVGLTIFRPRALRR